MKAGDLQYSLLSLQCCTCTALIGAAGYLEVLLVVVLKNRQPILSSMKPFPLVNQVACDEIEGWIRS